MNYFPFWAGCGTAQHSHVNNNELGKLISLFSRQQRTKSALTFFSVLRMANNRGFVEECNAALT